MVVPYCGNHTGQQMERSKNFVESFKKHVSTLLLNGDTVESEKTEQPRTDLFVRYLQMFGYLRVLEIIGATISWSRKLMTLSIRT